MKTEKVIGLVCVSIGLAAWPVLASDKPGTLGSELTRSIQGPGPKVSQPAAPAPVAKEAAPASKEPWVNVKVGISDDERRAIQTYADHNRAPEPRGKKGKALPPGLAKKAARGGQLPPGWQKKCARGEIMPPEVLEQSRPLPTELTVKLPPPPPGTITVTVEGKVVRLVKATHEILDAFDVHLP